MDSMQMAAAAVHALLSYGLYKCARQTQAAYRAAAESQRHASFDERFIEVERLRRAAKSKNEGREALAARLSLRIDQIRAAELGDISVGRLVPWNEALCSEWNSNLTVAGVQLRSYWALEGRGAFEPRFSAFIDMVVGGQAEAAIHLLKRTTR